MSAASTLFPFPPITGSIAMSIEFNKRRLEAQIPRLLANVNVTNLRRSVSKQLCNNSNMPCIKLSEWASRWTLPSSGIKTAPSVRTTPTRFLAAPWNYPRGLIHQLNWVRSHRKSMIPALAENCSCCTLLSGFCSKFFRRKKTQCNEPVRQATPEGVTRKTVLRR